MNMKKISNLVFIIMSFMILLSCCSATVYKVGDSKGWTITKKEAYRSWVRNKIFHVGDSLVFEYDQNVNDVTHVTNALEYVSCNSPSPKVVYNTGHDVVTFTEPGRYYFITSNHIQCVSGIKLDVLVVPGPSRPVPPPPPQPPREVHEPSRSISPPSQPPREVHEPSRPISPPPPSKVHELPRQVPPPPPPSKINGTPRPISPPPPPASSNTRSLGKLYKVGDSRGWGVYNSLYYYKWSQDRQFYVGDTLFFQYNKDLHDVEEIDNEFEFRNCEPTSTVAVYKTGHDLVKLTKPGVHYFVSMKTGLCTAGIKLRVTVHPLPEEAVTITTPPRVNRPNGWWWLRPFIPPHH